MAKRRKRGEPDDGDLRVARRGSTLLLRLHDRETQVLQWVFTDLERLLEGESASDAVTQRLFPRAYLDPTEEGAESEWQSMVHGDLVETRRSALGEVTRALGAATPTAAGSGMREVALDEAHAEQWMTVLNDARLAFGTALGVTAETDLDGIDPDDPRAEGYAVYDWLTHLLAALLGAMSEPGTGEDDDDDIADITDDDA
jgi:hypothetical protein